jgi:two-component system, chemotaxis family, protein-glutamate methylesterase/glutaminase
VRGRKWPFVQLSRAPIAADYLIVTVPVAIERTSPLRVCVIDDDPVYRRILAATLARIGGVELVAAVATLADAKRKIETNLVDLVTIDVQLKNESGLDLLPWLATRFPKVVTVLLTAGLAHEARLAVDALLLGASALVLKPSGPRAASALAEALANVVRAMPAASASAPATAGASAPRDARPREIVAVGASTGGPPVIVQFLKSLDASFDVPLLVAQHMPAVHAPFFAELLGRASGRDVRLAVHGEVIEPAGVYVAGDNKHLRVARAHGRLIVVQDEGPLENQCRPAVDPLFRSVAEVCGAAAIGVLMTGMGVDGAQGALAMRRRGAPIVVQDRETSTVWGMPGAAVGAGAATEVVPANALAAAVQARTSWTRRRRGAGAR